MGKRIRKSFVSPKNAWRIYQNVLLPAGQYTLACTTWAKHECEHLMSPFLTAILPKLGLIRHFPRVVIHSTTKYGGFQMAHFYTEQGYISVKHLLGHLQEQSVTGRHFMVLLSQVQLVSGNAQPYLGEVDTVRDYVLHSWLKGIWRFLSYTKATINVHDAWLPSAQQDNDAILMN
eukprot:4342323-Ditylum_brightwellii.AAC.1